MGFAFKWPACVSFAERTKLKFKGIPYHKLELLPCYIGESVAITVHLVLHISMHIKGISYFSSLDNCLQISICKKCNREITLSIFIVGACFSFPLLISDAPPKPTNGYEAIHSLLDAAKKQALILFSLLSLSKNSQCLKLENSKPGLVITLKSLNQIGTVKSNILLDFCTSVRVVHLWRKKNCVGVNDCRSLNSDARDQH